MKSLFFALLFLSCAISQLWAQTFLTAKVPERRQVSAGGNILLWLESDKTYPIVGWSAEDKPLLKTDYGNIKGDLQDKFKIIDGGSLVSKPKLQLKDVEAGYSTYRNMFSYRSTLVASPQGMYAILQVYADEKPFKNSVRGAKGKTFLLSVDIAKFPLGSNLTYAVHFYSGKSELQAEILED